MRRLLLFTYAGLLVVLAVVSVALDVLRDGVVAELQKSGGDWEKAIAKLDHYRAIQMWSGRGLLAAVLLVGLVLALTASREASRERLPSFVGVGLLGLGLGLAFWDPTIEHELTNLQRLVFFSTVLAQFGGVVAILVGLVPRARRLALFTVPVLLVVAAAGFELYLLCSKLEHITPTFRWAMRAVYTAPYLAAGAIAFLLASMPDVVADAASATRIADASARPRFPGTAFRTLGVLLFVRLGIGVATQGLIVQAMVSKNYAGAGTATSLGLLGTGLAAILGIAGLVGYLRIPSAMRRAELVAVVLVLQLFATGMDVWAANAADKLFAMIESMTKATSFWGMPSLSEMEELQSTLTWGGRVALVLGVVAAALLLAALRGTARALGSHRLDRIGQRAQTLLVLLGILAVVAGFLLGGTGGKDAVGMLIPIVLGMLGLAVALLVAWSRLLFGLARVAERGVEGESEAEAADVAPSSG